jgi:hypothetical protein
MKNILEIQKININSLKVTLLIISFRFRPRITFFIIL